MKKKKKSSLKLMCDAHLVKNEWEEQEETDLKQYISRHL